MVEAEHKLEMLWSFVKSHLQDKVIVFCSSCKQVQYIHAAFSALRPGTSLLCLHGRQKQMKRLATYTQFCQKAHVVLFATDVAARGLDFPQVGWGSASPYISLYLRISPASAAERVSMPSCARCASRSEAAG